MFSVLLLTLKSILVKVLTSLAAEAFLEYTIFKSAELLVAKTNTKHDDEWLAKFKEAYHHKDKDEL